MTVTRSFIVNIVGGFAVGIGLFLAAWLPRLEPPRLLFVDSDGHWAIIVVLPRVRPAGYEAGREHFTPDPGLDA